MYGQRDNSSRGQNPADPPGENAAIGSRGQRYGSRRKSKNNDNDEDRGSPTMARPVTNYRAMRDGDRPSRSQQQQQQQQQPHRASSQGSPSRKSHHNERSPSSPSRSSSHRHTGISTSPSSTSTSTTPTHNYRGFSTSIGDMFAHPHQERVDCCAMTCCGILQSDRDRFLLQGVTPPSPWKRIWVHLCMPLILFLTAGFVALNIPDHLLNNLFCLMFLLMLLGGIVTQCQKGRMKRTDIRKDVLWFKYQLLNNSRHQRDNNNHDLSSLEEIMHQPRPDDHETYYYRGQTERDIGCSHPVCFLVGCYRTDRPNPTLLLSECGSVANDVNQVEASLCSCIFQFFCRPYCGMHMQYGGVCGMAQESREIEATLLPPAYRRLDYVTMQPMLAYFEGIYNRRWRQFNTLNTAGPAGPKAIGPFEFWTWERPHLSLLSKVILQAWVGLTVFLGIWSGVGPLFWTSFVNGEGRRHFFYWQDYLVYLASWVVTFGTLAFVIYLCQRHKPLELSLDAMVKYFASGFLLSTTLSIFYELVVGIALRLCMMALMMLSGTKVVQDNGYEMAMDWAQQPLTGFGGGNIRSAKSIGGYLPIFGRSHPVVYSIYLFLNAYFLAAMVEEICKYFGFRMIEHPDFLTKADLEDAANSGVIGEDGKAGPSAAESGGKRRVMFPQHAQSLQSQGAAITVAMVCVALGFAACEDLIYIFLYHGSSVGMEVYVLLARTLFPIHPICAALQSIGVTERDVEKHPKRFGRVLLPAILFHGTYDFLLLWIDFLASLKRSDGYNDNSDEALEVGTHAVVLSYTLSTIMMGMALYWFYRESNNQRERLEARDIDPAASDWA